MPRPDWDTYFLDMAELASTRATCLRGKVGAVIVKDHRVIAMGYNGAPRGEAHCTDVGCLMEDNHCQRTIHAEVNAVAQAGRDSVGATMYIVFNTTGSSNFPEPVPGCRECNKTIRAAGITRVLDRIGGKVGEWNYD